MTDAPTPHTKHAEKPAEKKAEKPSFVIAATGRRKTSTARVRLLPGSGKITINGEESAAYLQRATLQMAIVEPLTLTDSTGKYDIIVNATGGGKSGQAGAIRHGISRALVKLNESLKTTLRKGTFLTRDPRMKERKKYGQKGARKRFQWTKR